MKTVEENTNPYFWDYERLLRKVHRMIAEGEGDDEAADALREELLDLHFHLSSTEREHLQKLSADLYMLQDKEVLESCSAKMSSHDIGLRLKQAWDENDFERVLSLLRQGPEFLSRDEIAYLRARSYAALGHHETAFLFMDYAATLAPADATYQYITLDLLEEANDTDEVLRRAYGYLFNNQASPAVLIKSSAVIFAAIKDSDRRTVLDRYSQAVVGIVRALNEGEASSLPREVLLLGYSVLAHSLLELGNLVSARDAFKEILRIEPDNKHARESVQAIDNEITKVLDTDPLLTPPVPALSFTTSGPGKVADLKTEAIFARALQSIPKVVTCR